MLRKGVPIVALFFILIISGCAGHMGQNTQSGALVGGGYGALAGAIGGSFFGNPALGAAIGAAVLAPVGALIGNRADQQQDAANAQAAAEQKRIQEAGITECDIWRTSDQDQRRNPVWRQTDKCHTKKKFVGEPSIPQSREVLITSPR